MKKLLAVLLAAALLLCGVALADALPSFSPSSDASHFPDPGTYADAEAKLFQLNYPYNGAEYDAYEYELPADLAVFLAGWQAALQEIGFETTLGFEQGNSAVFFSNGSIAGFLLYGYQGRMLLMIPSEYGFEPAAAEEPAAEEPAAEEPAAEEPAAEPEPEPVEEPAAEPEPEPVEEPAAEPEPEPAEEPAAESSSNDLASDMVEEFDPAESEVSFEYIMEQEHLAVLSQGLPVPTDIEAQIIAIVPYGQSYTFSTEIKPDGTARVIADDEPYETVSFTVTMKEYLLPSDFEDRYAEEYRLMGDEAGVSFDLVLNDYSGAATIVPQNVLDIGFCDTSGAKVERGFQLMDAEVNGGFDVAVASNTPKTLYKRFNFYDATENMQYMVVCAFTDGKEQIMLFDLEGARPEPKPEPEVVEPEITYPELAKGDKSEDVKVLQARLIELKFLDDKADGIFGRNTQAAVKAAQKAYGMEQTGIADNAFQQRLFSDDQ